MFCLLYLIVSQYLFWHNEHFVKLWHPESFLDQFYSMVIRQVNNQIPLFSIFTQWGKKTAHAFIPAEAHVSQNPVLVIIEVDLSGLREESVGQFSSDAVETVVQVGLQTVGVVSRVEAW